MRLYFVTSNMHKFREVQEMVAPHGIMLVHTPLHYPEVRAESCEEVAREAVRSLARVRGLKRPFIVEDSGLFIDALNGFPGTYSKWAYEKIGLKGILALMRGARARSARFVSSIGYYDGRRLRVFTGTVDGTIAKRIRGESGFAYDPLFIPKGYKFSFAENMTLKSTLSHRKRAVELMLKSILMK
ncbi:MAG: XTP/dITP diphosphatase [Candidatus Micrarchaeota archaeon]|nr:XTP/dITP diphosphatase [Candidatus Micrarchaeota archaeon]